MTPIALIFFGFLCYFFYRYKNVALYIFLAWRQQKRLEADRAAANRRRLKHGVKFFTVEQVWGDEEGKKSA